MGKMKFEPGYYEWNLYLNGEIIWTCDDFSDNLPEEVNEESACDMADLLMVQMESDFKENGKEFTDALRVMVTEAIADKIEAYYR